MSKQPELPEKLCSQSEWGCSVLVQPADRWGTGEMDQGINRNEIQVGKIKQMLVTTEERNEIPVLSPISCVNLGKLLKLLCASVSILLILWG